MQSESIIEDGPDLVIRLTWAERMAIYAKCQEFQRNFDKVFDRAEAKTENKREVAL
jgi:hypothetical protein